MKNHELKLEDLVVEPTDCTTIEDYNQYRWRAKNYWTDQTVYYWSHTKLKGVYRREDGEQVYQITKKKNN